MRRIVVGAHGGLGEWLAQRGTAVLMTVATAVLGVALLLHSPGGHREWVAFMGIEWVRVTALLFLLALGWHAWIGGRDIFMDYIKPDGVRVLAHFVLAVHLVACMVWAALILWR